MFSSPIRNSVKRRADECPNEKPSKLICRAVRGKEENLTASDLKNMRNAICRQRLKNRPTLPKSHEETLGLLKNGEDSMVSAA